METVQISVPADLAKFVESEGMSLSVEAARLLALELYRNDKVSLGRASELCQMPIAAFMEFAHSHGVPTIRYTFEDIEEEKRNLERLGV